MISDDGGLTWRLGADDTRTNNTVKPQELSLVELLDGSIYAAARDQFGDDAGNRAYAISSDGGLTWDRPFRTMPDFSAPVVQGSIASYDEERLLYAAPAHPVTREAMAVRSSYDEGKTWETWQDGKVIHWGPAAYSDLIRLDGDDVGLLYEAGETSPYEGIRFWTNHAFLPYGRSLPCLSISWPPWLSISPPRGAWPLSWPASPPPSPSPAWQRRRISPAWQWRRIGSWPQTSPSERRTPRLANPFPVRSSRRQALPSDR